MRFDIMTLFPDLVNTVLGESIIGRAQKSGSIEIACHNIRDFSEDKHHRVDDTPYGGGKGMLMMAPPIYDCYRHIVDNCSVAEVKPHVVFMSPFIYIFVMTGQKHVWYLYSVKFIRARILRIFNISA